MNETSPEPQSPCLDDYPELARLGARQQFINRWSQLLAIAPFAAFIFIDFSLLAGSNSPWMIALVLLSLLWAISLVSYSFYIRFWGGIRCPVCEKRFGSGDKCRHCDLPRHRRVPFLLPNLTASDD